MTATPNISIVIPARNAADTITRTLDSVLAQTSSHWELIVVDDGSTDATATLVRDLTEGRTEVVVVEGPGAGVSAARNVGTEAATHDHVLYLDADDRIDERYIELMAGALRDDPTLDGVRCIWAYETPDGRTQPWDDLDLSDLFATAARRCPFAIHACVIRRDLVLSVGGFDTGLVVGEDWDLWQRIARVGCRLGFVAQELAYYLMHPRSVMHVDLERMHHDLLAVAQRGAKPDDRVRNPLPDAIDGIPFDATFDVEAVTLAGTLACAVPTTVELATLIPDHPADPTRDVSASQLAGTIHESVAFGSCALLDDWPTLYGQWIERIQHMLDLYEQWLGRTDLQAQTLRELEAMIVRTAPMGDHATIGRTALRALDLGEIIRDLKFGDGVDQAMIAVHHGTGAIGFVRLPVIDGHVDHHTIEAAVTFELGPRLLTRARRTPQLALRMLPAATDRELRKGVRRFVLDTPWRRKAGIRFSLDRFLRWSATRIAGTIVRTEPAEPSDPVAGVVPLPDRDDPYGEDFFDDIFEYPDPWSYSGNYEQTKYKQTLSVLGERRFDRALELACAEGHFTVQLACRVGHLVAADISPTALERAAERCHEFSNIEYRHVDLRDDDLPASLDLIVCSEVLYFVKSEDRLAEVGRRFADALAPGGLLVMAHANLILDDPDRTGFDWDHEFGARRIGEIMMTVDGLHHVSTSVSDLYRIHLFERSTDAQSIGPGTEIEIPHADDLDAHISRMALWGGAVITRPETYRTEVSHRIPVLAYHRVSDSGHPLLDDYRVTPDALGAQLEYLRRNGYYGLRLEQLRSALASHRSPPGRAVLITFDDGYEDVFENAWPRLRDYDFPATVFAVTDRVGAAADWDSRFGEPPALMGWEELRFLQRHGFDIGSHTASHAALPSLSPADALTDATRARERLRGELGSDARALAYPFGIADELVRATMRGVGHDLGFTTSGELATVWHDPMNLPRINVGMDMTTEELARRMGQPASFNPLRRAGVAARRLLLR